MENYGNIFRNPIYGREIMRCELWYSYLPNRRAVIKDEAMNDQHDRMISCPRRL